MARRPAKSGETVAGESGEEFLRLMSHEMRTPLNGVIGMLGLIAGTRLDAAQTAYVSAARDSAEHLLGLVNDLLDFARLEAGKIEFENAPVEVERLVQGVAELLSPRAHDRGLEIVWSVDGDVPDLMGDDGRLRQILFNLGGNAVKFTESGGVRLSVERAGGTDDRPVVRFIVDDTGPGVPESARARIFEQFGHADASDARRHDGAGLGLAVVEKLARAMGGRAAVEDRPGGGARFYVEAVFEAAPETVRGGSLDGLRVAVRSPDRLVRAAAQAQIEASGGKAVRANPELVLIDHAGAADGALAGPPDGAPALILLRPEERDLIQPYRDAGYAGYLIKPLRRASVAERARAIVEGASARRETDEDDRVQPRLHAGLRVLLAEDNPVNALLARALLTREGCAVETAATGAEALDALGRARFDLVLMDMRMPGMDGLEAARKLRRLGDETPIVALTANAFPEDRRACLEAGMNDHLAKPLDIDQLRGVLARWTKPTTRAKLAS